MLKLIFSAGVVAGAIAMSGCAVTPCANQLNYRNAQAHSAPVIPGNLKSISADPAYEIPPGKISKKGPATPSQCIIFPPQVIDPANPPKKAG